MAYLKPVLLGLEAFSVMTFGGAAAACYALLSTGASTWFGAPQQLAVIDSTSCPHITGCQVKAEQQEMKSLATATCITQMVVTMHAHHGMMRLSMSSGE